MKRLIRSMPFQVLVPLAAVACAWLLFGPIAAAGAGVGCVVGVAGFWGLWYIVGQMGAADGPEGRGPLPTILLVLAYIGKVLLFIGGVAVVYRLGGEAPSGFVFGLILVYSLGIGWAQVST